MCSVIILCMIGLVSSQLDWQHGHNLRDMIDAGFARLDQHPKDGIVTQTEFDIIETKNDLNNDSCISYQEYHTTRPHLPTDVATKMYQHIDVDHDSCVSVQDLHAEYHLMDHNADGQVNLHEFEQYLTHMLNKLLGHQG